MKNASTLLIAVIFLIAMLIGGAGLFTPDSSLGVYALALLSLNILMIIVLVPASKSNFANTPSRAKPIDDDKKKTSRQKTVSFPRTLFSWISCLMFIASVIKSVHHVVSTLISDPFLRVIVSFVVTFFCPVAAAILGFVINKIFPRMAERMQRNWK